MPVTLTIVIRTCLFELSVSLLDRSIHAHEVIIEMAWSRTHTIVKPALAAGDAAVVSATATASIVRGSVVASASILKTINLLLEP